MSPRLVYRPASLPASGYVDPLLSLLVGRDVELVDPPAWMPSNEHTSWVRPVGSDDPAQRVQRADLQVIVDKSDELPECSECGRNDVVQVTTSGEPRCSRHRETEQSPVHADCELEPLCGGEPGLTTTREGDVDCSDCLALLALVADPL